MKCIKLTYKSPLFGSVYCEELIDDPESRIGFGAHATLQLYNRDPYLMRFLSENSKDLAEHVPEELSGLVLKAVFGIDFVDEHGLYLLTEVYLKKEPTDVQYIQLKGWVVGQLSDGWGESVEQQEVKTEKIYFNKPMFDAINGEFEEEELRVTAYYYVHPWSYDKNWYLDLINHEEVELDIPEDDPKQAILEEINANLVRIMNALKDIT